MPDALHAIPSGWDGKQTEPLEAAFCKYRSDPEFLASLVGLCKQEPCQRGATWLLKHHFETKGPPPTVALTKLHFNTLPRIQPWEAKLHFLQYLEFLDIPAEAKSTLEAFVHDAISSENKLVRAWAYYGLATIARQFPETRRSALEALTKARSNEVAGSVKIRVRKALEKLSK
ncbi:MAG: hypothetical protein K5905_28590 [Roseibium sp.]|uniref:hypothetical protein n=1 Tax=Roseibium sp. TaxID=1936156 RepID=UPI002622967A|nr:hypothetical protein [Roseibium sp.]MCV0429422.1 hypothetical protein [Roseibium sp.]